MKARTNGKCAGGCGLPILTGQNVVRPFGPAPWHSACYGKYAVKRDIPMSVRVKVR